MGFLMTLGRSRKDSCSVAPMTKIKMLWLWLCRWTKTSALIQGTIPLTFGCHALIFPSRPSLFTSHNTRWTVAARTILLVPSLEWHTNLKVTWLCTWFKSQTSMPSKYPSWYSSPLRAKPRSSKLEPKVSTWIQCRVLSNFITADSTSSGTTRSLIRCPQQ